MAPGAILLSSGSRAGRDITYRVRSHAIFCPLCNTENDAGQGYCRQCGLSLGGVRLAVNGRAGEALSRYKKGGGAFSADIYSGHGSHPDRAAGLRAGAELCLVKPDTREIMPAVERLLGEAQAANDP